MRRLVLFLVLWAGSAWGLHLSGASRQQRTLTPKTAKRSSKPPAPSDAMLRQHVATNQKDRLTQLLGLRSLFGPVGSSETFGDNFRFREVKELAAPDVPALPDRSAEVKPAEGKEGADPFDIS